MYYLLKVRKENKLSKEQKSFNLAEFDFFLKSDMTCFDLRTETETDKELMWLILKYLEENGEINGQSEYVAPA